MISLKLISQLRLEVKFTLYKDYSCQYAAIYHSMKPYINMSDSMH